MRAGFFQHCSGCFHPGHRKTGNPHFTDSGARTNPYHPLKGAKSAFRASPAVPSLQIPSPGFKSDILHGKTGLCGPQPPASSHIWRPLVWNTCAVTLDYNTIQPPVLQGFFEIFPDFFQFSIPVKTRALRRGCPGKKPQKTWGFPGARAPPLTWPPCFCPAPPPGGCRTPPRFWPGPVSRRR